ncbi:transcriptional regulator with XRE-family HTH domain [Spinactinospora alkalitolerans]|uniref:Transcriptional regulator with XRE-family HTH domain n=1 Tax=Spinactinospora alkalitolerans TaxID=687207 RepID=A0A852U230_9ACTN|nr:helix-turn-helix transcriptional regulator [Spinactinospora alkalitolerans]NYE50249.1 transcriptional regulator with XRE-family HTH domain [Spinactinospora alkalitolerans]
MTDGTPDPFEVSLSFGQRLKLLRTRRGMTREVLAGLTGKSASWVKAVESGRLGMPKLSILLRLAEALRARNLSELTGQQSIPVDMFTGPGHERLPAVRAAVNAFPALTQRPAPPVAHLRARLDQAWAARHSAPNHREVLGLLLPGLITDAQLAAHQADSGRQRRAAQAVLAEVYALAQFFIAYQPAQDLLWRVAERGMVAAQDSGDAHAIGVASWLMAQAHRDAGDWDAADVVTSQTVRVLAPMLPDGPDDVLAIWGALQFEAGYTAARRGELGNAWGHWDTANDAAQRLPAAYYHPVTSFSRAIMGAHAVTVAVELRAGGESVRQAEHAPDSAIPSRPRRARHQIEQARAYHLDAQPDAALAVLDAAHDAAPETIKYNGYARRILLEELDARQSQRRQRATALADKVGLLT